MKKIFEKMFQIIGMFFSFLFLFIIACILEGFTLSNLWEWFVVPLGLRPINVLHAIGICVLLDFITYHYYDYRKSEEIGVVSSLTYIIIRPLIAMIVGVSIKYFI